MELNSDIKLFDYSYNPDNPNEVIRNKYAQANRDDDRLLKVFTTLASYVGAEGIARSLLTSGVTQPKVEEAIAKISAKIAKLRNLSDDKITKIQNKIDALSNLGFILTGPALDNISKQKAKLNEKLDSAKTLSSKIEPNLDRVSAALEGVKTNDRMSNFEADRFNRTAEEADNYLEGLSKQYEEQSKL